LTLGAQAGAEVHDTLQPAHVVLGIKETPLSELDTLLSPLDGRSRTHVVRLAYLHGVTPRD